MSVRVIQKPEFGENDASRGESVPDLVQSRKWSSGFAAELLRETPLAICQNIGAKSTVTFALFLEL